MQSALKWFGSNEIKNIEINVVYANDVALPFYKRHGFHIGNYILKRNWLKRRNLNKILRRLLWTILN